MTILDRKPSRYRPGATAASVGLACLLILLLLPGNSYGQRAIIIVRHAEKVDQSSDSSLSKVGYERAQLLAKLLQDAGVTAIYTTQYQRTLQTAEPLAKLTEIKPVSMPADDTGPLFDRIRAFNKKDIVLIVGHSNTIPQLLRLFGWGGDISIGTDEYSNVFVLVPQPGSAPLFMRFRY